MSIDNLLPHDQIEGSILRIQQNRTSGRHLPLRHQSGHRLNEVSLHRAL
jgi:hypothetical protein